MRGATYVLLLSWVVPCVYFNPRAHEGRDMNVNVLHQTTINISIHAPMRGATACIVESVTCDGISIHAPMRGATKALGLTQTELAISIHAPMRGATKAIYKE